jgi:hypothetical protein
VEKLIGYGKDEAMGRSAPDFLVPNDRGSAFLSIKEDFAKLLVRTGVVRRLAVPVLRKDGTLLFDVTTT